MAVTVQENEFSPGCQIPIFVVTNNGEPVDGYEVLVQPLPSENFNFAVVNVDPAPVPH